VQNKNILKRNLNSTIKSNLVIALAGLILITISNVIGGLIGGLIGLVGFFLLLDGIIYFFIVIFKNRKKPTAS
jgi:uncharacterized Tic20 family protein